MLDIHDNEKQQVHRIDIGETIKLRADSLLPLQSMINIGIYVHLVDPDLIEELLNILTFIWRVLFLGVLLSGQLLLRQDPRRLGKRVILLYAIGREPEGRSTQVDPQAHLPNWYLRHHLVPLGVLLLLIMRDGT